MSFFVTSVAKGDGGNYGGLAGADAHCQMLAQAAGRGNVKWVAYLSTQGPGAVNARDRIGQGPWHNARGRIIAANLAELHGDNAGSSREWATVINKNNALTEKGGTVKGVGDQPNEHDILTGSTPDGRAYTDGMDHTCSNYTSNVDGKGNVQVGHHDQIGNTNGSWNSAHASRGCSQKSLPTERRRRLPVLLCPRQLNQRPPFSSRSHLRRNMRLATGAMSASPTFPSSSDGKAGCRRACLRASSASATHRG